MSDPPPPERKNYFLLGPCFADEASGEYTGREVWQKLREGGGGIHQVAAYDPPKNVRDATAL